MKNKINYENLPLSNLELSNKTLIEHINNFDKLKKYAQYMADNNLYIDPKRLLRMIENEEFNYEK